MIVMADVPVAEHSDPACAGVFRSALSSMIPRVSDDEIMQAFASTTLSADQCDDASPASVSASLRSLNIQNNVLFRMIVHSRLFQSKHTGMLNVRCYLLHCGHTSRRSDFVNRCDFKLIFVFVDVCWIVAVVSW